MTHLVRVYDLANDQRRVDNVQEATLTTTEYGLVPEIALYGSPKWWQAIEDGRIERRQVDGVICDVFTSGDSDWPLFEIDTNGCKSVWTRYGDPESYIIGKQVKLTYVTQKRKKSWAGVDHQNEVVAIDVEV